MTVDRGQRWSGGCNLYGYKDDIFLMGIFGRIPIRILGIRSRFFALLCCLDRVSQYLTHLTNERTFSCGPQPLPKTRDARLFLSSPPSVSPAAAGRQPKPRLLLQLHVSRIAAPSCRAKGNTRPTPRRKHTGRTASPGAAVAPPALAPSRSTIACLCATPPCAACATHLRRR